MSENALFDQHGNRLYLNAQERSAFLTAAQTTERPLKCLCHTLHYTGCRISEALELPPRRVDLADTSLRVRSLKKRDGRIIYRDIPVPPALTEMLDLVFGIREIQRRGQQKQLDAPLWPWTRVHAWRLVTGVMIAAGIPDGPHRTPRACATATASTPCVRAFS